MKVHGTPLTSLPRSSLNERSSGPPLYCAAFSRIGEGEKKLDPPPVQYLTASTPEATRAKLSRKPRRVPNGARRGTAANLLTPPRPLQQGRRTRHDVDLNNLPERNAAFCKISFVAPFDVLHLSLLCPQTAFLLPSSLAFPSTLFVPKHVPDPSSEHL